MKIKRYLFLATTVLSISSIVACLNIYFCIVEKGKEFRRNFGGMEKTVLTLHNEFSPGKGWNERYFMNYEDMLEITKKCKNASEVIIEMHGSGSKYSEGIITLLKNNKVTYVVNNLGVSAGYDKLVGLTMEEGRFFRKEEEGSDVCVILEDLAKRLDAKVSDTVKYMGREFKIIGIVGKKRPFDINIAFPDDEVYLPIRTARQLYGASYPSIIGYLMYYPAKRELVYQELINLLEDKYGKDKEFAVAEGDTCMLGLEFIEILWSFGLFFLICIFLLINKKCLSKYLSLSYIDKSRALMGTCLLTGIGGLLGTAFGLGMSHHLIREPKISILYIFVSLSIGIIFNLLIAIRRVKRIEALR